jgi:hypothetical protein
MRLPSLSKSKSEVFGQSGHCSARLLPPLSAITGREQMQQGLRIDPDFAVGTRVTPRPPPRSVRAAFPHTAPTSGINGNSVP